MRVCPALLHSVLSLHTTASLALPAHCALAHSRQQRRLRTVKTQVTVSLSLAAEEPVMDRQRSSFAVEVLEGGRKEQWMLWGLGSTQGRRPEMVRSDGAAAGFSSHRTPPRPVETWPAFKPCRTYASCETTGQRRTLASGTAQQPRVTAGRAHLACGLLLLLAQEDAHLVNLDLEKSVIENEKDRPDTTTALFGVFDGHGGKEVRRAV